MSTGREVSQAELFEYCRPIKQGDPNGGSWLAMQGKEPVGRWELKLPDTDAARDLFKCGKVEDIFVVIAFSGTTPSWPA